MRYNNKGLCSAYMSWGEHEEGEPDATCHLKCIWIVGTGTIGWLVGFVPCPKQQLGFFHPADSGIAGVGQALLEDSVEQDSFSVFGLGEDGLLLRRNKSVILEALNYPCCLLTYPLEMMSFYEVCVLFILP